MILLKNETDYFQTKSDFKSFFYYKFLKKKEIAIIPPKYIFSKGCFYFSHPVPVQTLIKSLTKNKLKSIFVKQDSGPWLIYIPLRSASPNRALAKNNLDFFKNVIFINRLYWSDKIDLLPSPIWKRSKYTTFFQQYSPHKITRFLYYSHPKPPMNECIFVHVPVYFPMKQITPEHLVGGHIHIQGHSILQGGNHLCVFTPQQVNAADFMAIGKHQIRTLS